VNGNHSLTLPAPPEAPGLTAGVPKATIHNTGARRRVHPSGRSLNAHAGAAGP
jgi:hypothetical protein